MANKVVVLPGRQHACRCCSKLIPAADIDIVMTDDGFYHYWYFKNLTKIGVCKNIAMYFNENKTVPTVDGLIDVAWDRLLLSHVDDKYKESLKKDLLHSFSQVIKDVEEGNSQIVKINNKSSYEDLLYLRLIKIYKEDIDYLIDKSPGPLDFKKVLKRARNKRSLSIIERKRVNEFIDRFGLNKKVSLQKQNLFRLAVNQN